MSWFITIISILAGFYVFICVLVYFFQDKLIFFPEKLAKNDEFYFENPFTEVYLVDNSPNDVLHSLWFKAFSTEKSKKVVLYFHGNAGCLTKWGHIADDFLDLGYDILIVDYRQYGKSKGNLDKKTLYNDAQIALDFLENHYEKSNITVYGRSIGTGIATHLASKNHIKRLILETPFYNFGLLVSKFIPFLPVNLLLRFDFDTSSYIKNVKCPVFIFHGTNDEVIPYYFGEMLAKNILSTHFITIPNGNHNNLRNFELYHNNLKNILK